MTTKEIIKELKRIKKQADYQDYGWSDLERDLEKLIDSLKPTKEKCKCHYRSECGENPDEECQHCRKK